jgi:hypothetical protein
MSDAYDEQAVRRLLENHELFLVLDSPDNDYRFEYFTTALKDRVTGIPKLNRTYRLIDLIRGGITSEPWDIYNLEKQVVLVTNLMRFSNYRMTKIVSGWTVVCASCGSATTGKHWDSTAKNCPACKSKLNPELVQELLFM